MPVCWKDWTNQQFFSLLSTGGHAGIIVIIVVVVVAIVPQNVMHDPTVTNLQEDELHNHSNLSCPGSTSWLVAAT
jgi:hypothetical protein